MFYKHINCCRYIWNYMLDLQIKNYAEENKYICEFDMIRLLTSLKNEDDKAWLYEVSNSSLQTICRDLNKAYEAYFDGRCRFPKFKSKRESKLSFPACASPSKFYFTDDEVHIQKVGKVKYKTDLNPPKGNTVKFYNPRIKNIRGKWILIVGVEYENQVLNNPVGRVGIDLGIKKLATISYFYNDCNGNDYMQYGNINKSNRMKRLERRSIHYNRVMARKRRVNNDYKVKCEDGKYRRYDSNNYKKIRKRYQHVEGKMANIRLNYIHHITKHIVELKPGVITMEDLNIKKMLKNPTLSPYIQKACWRKFRDIMEHKGTHHGIVVKFAPTWFPSSKYCSNCGHLKRKFSLSDRMYVCKKCGLVIDRDVNAAINLQWFNYDRT